MEEWVILCTSLKEQLAKERAKNAGRGGGGGGGGREGGATAAVADPPMVIGTRRPREALG